jgi:hypothetical protein
MPSASGTGSAQAALPQPLAPEELRKVHACWRAANYLSVGQIYLLANPLLREPLLPSHIKHRLLGHSGTTPGGVQRKINGADGENHGGKGTCANGRNGGDERRGLEAS